MNNDYQIYDICFDEQEDIGLTAISFVDMPAICQDFVYFSDKQRIEPTKIKQGSILMASAEKREIISPILIPNQLILRMDEFGNKYYVRWTAETIQKVAQYYVANQFLNNFTIQHSWFEAQDGNYKDSFIKDVYCLKFWIIEDAKNDEINKKYGYHLPQGTLCVHLKIHNRKLWQRIKSGELKGLSIEAFCSQIPTGNIKLSKNTNYSMKKKIKDRIALMIAKYNSVVDELKELETLAENDSTEEGEVSLRYFTDGDDYIEVASDGTATASDGAIVEDGEYKLLDGNVIVIADGKFVETKPITDAEEVPEEAPIAEEKEDNEEDKEIKEEDKEIKEEEEEIPYTLVDVEIEGTEYKVPQEVADYIHTLEDAKDNLETANENFRKEIVNLKKQIPSVEPIRAKQAKVEDSKPDFKSVIEKLNRK